MTPGPTLLSAHLEAQYPHLHLMLGWAELLEFTDVCVHWEDFLKDLTCDPVTFLRKNVTQTPIPFLSGSVAFPYSWEFLATCLGIRTANLFWKQIPSWTFNYLFPPNPHFPAIILFTSRLFQQGYPLVSGNHCMYSIPIDKLCCESSQAVFMDVLTLNNTRAEVMPCFQA